MTESVLLLPSVPEFDEAVLQIFDRALQENHVTEKSAVEKVVQALKLRIDCLLAPRLTSWNAEAPLHRRLPDELWCTIWEDVCFSMAERVRISQVCHDWRQLAIGAPRLWCRLDVWTRQCWCCDGPTHQDPSVTTTAKSSSSYNLDALSAILQRSRDQPLFLHVCSPVHNARRKTGSVLGDMLAPHAARLVEIHAAVNNAHILGNMLLRFDSLPLLEVLIAESATSRCMDERIELGLGRLAIPRLQRLALRHSNFDVLPTMVAPLSSVTKLEYTFTSARDLRDILTVFPRLASATLRPIDAEPFFQVAELPHIRALARRIPCLTIRDISSRQLPTLLDIFAAAPSRAALTLHLREGEHPRVGTGALAVFDDLRDGRLHVCCTTDALEIRDEVSGRRRALAADGLDALVPEVWADHLSRASVRTLKGDVLVWDRIGRGWGPECGIVGIELLVPPGFDLERLDIRGCGPFPALETLKIVACSTEVLAIPEAWLQRFMATLGAPQARIELHGAVLGRESATASSRPAVESMC